MGLADLGARLMASVTVNSCLLMPVFRGFILRALVTQARLSGSSKLQSGGLKEK